jgi:hypothetical protein
MTESFTVAAMAANYRMDWCRSDLNYRDLTGAAMAANYRGWTGAARNGCELLLLARFGNGCDWCGDYCKLYCCSDGCELQRLERCGA